MSSTSKQPDKVVKSNERERSESSESCETRSRSSSVSSDTSVEIIPNPKIRKFKGNDLPSTSNRPVPKSRSSDRPVRQVAKRARSASSTPSNTSRSNSQSRGRPRTREKKKKATKAAVRSPSDGSPVPASYSPDCHASSSAKERKVVQISRSSSSDSSDTEVVPPKSKKSKKSKTSKEKEPKNSKSNDSKKKSKTEEMTKKSKNGKHVSSNKKSPKKNNNKNPIETESDDSRSSNGDSESSDNELERDETEEDTDETDYVILSSDAEQNDSDGSNYRPSDSKGLRPGTGPSLRSNNPFVPRRSKRTCGNYPLYVDLSSDSDEQSDSTVRNDETNVESVPGSSSKKAKTRKQKTVQMEVEEPGEQQASESNNAEEKKKRGRPRKIKVEVMNTEENEKEVPLGIQMAVVEADPEKLISKTSETPGIKTRSSYKKAASSAAVAENITARGQGKNNSLSGRGSASLVPAADIDTESSEEEPSSSEPKPIKQRETKNSIAASLNICRSSVGPNMFIKNELVEPAPEQELVANQGNPGMEPSSPSQAQDNSLDLNSNLHPIPSLLVGNEEQDSNRLIVDDNTVLPQAPAQNQQGTSSSVQLMPLNHGALLSMLPKASIKVEVMEQEEEEESLLTSTPLEVAAPKRTRGSRKRYSPTPERESTSSSVDKSTKQKHIKNNDHPGLHHQDLSVSVGFSGSLHSSSNTSPNSSVATSALSSPQVLGTMQVATKTIKMEVPDHSNPKQPENEYCPHITNILESLFELHPNYIDHQTKIWSDWRINTSLSPYRINKWLDDRRQQDGLPRLTTQRSSNVHPRSLTRTEPLPLETGSVNDILEALFAAYPNYKEGESQKSRLKQVIHWSKYKINKWFDNKRNQLRALEQDSQQQQNTNEQPHQTTDNIATDQLPIDEAPQSEEIVNESPQEAISIQSPFAPLNIEYLDAPSNALIPVQNGFNCKMEMSTADQNQTFWGYEWEVPASEQNGSDYHTVNGTPMPDQPKYSFNSIVEAPPSVPHGFGYNTGMQMPNRQATYDTYSWQTQVPMDNGFGGRMGMISNQQNFCKLGRETPAPAVSDKHVIAILEKHFAEHPEYTDTEWGGNLLRKKTGWSSMQINLWFKTKRNQKLILDRIAAQMKLVVEFPQENDSPSLEDQQATLLLEGVYQSDPEYVEFGYTKLEDDTKWSQEQINDWFYARRNQDQMLNDIFFHQYQFVSKQRAEELSQSVGLSALKIYMWFFETRVKIFRDHQQKILKELPLQMKILEEAYISCHDYEQHDIQNLKKLSGTTYFQAAGYFKSRRQIDVMRDSTRCMTSEDPKREGFDFMYPHVHKEYSVFDLHEYHFPKNLYSGQTDNEKVRKCRKRARGHLFEKIPLPFNHSIYYEKYTPSEAFEFFDQFLSPNALNTLRGRGIYTDDLKRFLAQDESLFNELNAETRIYCLKYDAFSKLDFLKVGDILHQIHSAALQWVDNFHAPNQ